jgi:hypothetical protein
MYYRGHDEDEMTWWERNAEVIIIVAIFVLLAVGIFYDSI